MNEQDLLERIAYDRHDLNEVEIALKYSVPYDDVPILIKKSYSVTPVEMPKVRERAINADHKLTGKLIEHKDKIVALYESGMRHKEIADRYGVHFNAVKYVLTEAGIYGVPPQTQPGKLDEYMDVVRGLRDKGRTYKEIANYMKRNYDVDVSETTVRRSISRRVAGAV